MFPRRMPHYGILAIIFANGANFVNGNQMLQAFSPPTAQWTKGVRALSNDTFDLAIGMKAENPQALEAMFWKIADPTNDSYGHHLDRDQVDALTAPNTTTMNDLKRWLKVNSIDNISFSSTTNRLRVRASIRALEELFQTEIHEYNTGTTSTRLLRASTSLSIPSSIQPHVAYVNLNSHPIGRSLKGRGHHASNPIEDAHAGGGITPQFLREWYGIPKQTNANETNAQGIPEFYDEAWSDSDLSKFFKEYMDGHAMPTLVTHHVTNRDDSIAKASGEASLDLQYLTALAPRTTTYVWSETGTNPYSAMDEPFVEWAEEVLKMKKPPYVVSISYSDDEEQIFRASEAYARSFDPLLMKLAVRGVSVLISSGDDGVAGQRPGLLKMDVRDKSAWCKQHGPQWPSGNPYLTSVGATMFAKPSFSSTFFSTNDEVVCSSQLGSTITSGGGFSSKYERPSYQDAAVKRYLTTRNIPPADFFNSSGRGYPDISAFGNNYIVFVKGVKNLISGTSASSPVLASMITLVNDRRLNAGKPPLGFLNPALYLIQEKYPSAFYDITIGNNGAGMGDEKPICDTSFHAESGWDAATGLGTPNFEILKELLFNVEEVFKGNHIPIPEFHQEDKNSITSQSILVIGISLGLCCIVILGSILYVRRNTNLKAYMEVNPDKADTPKYPIAAKTDAIFTIDHEEDEEIPVEIKLTEVNLDR